MRPRYSADLLIGSFLIAVSVTIILLAHNKDQVATPPVQVEPWLEGARILASTDTLHHAVLHTSCTLRNATQDIIRAVVQHVVEYALQNLTVHCPK